VLIVKSNVKEEINNCIINGTLYVKKVETAIPLMRYVYVPCVKGIMEIVANETIFRLEQIDLHLQEIITT
jgi:hypothetical protein